MPCSAVVIGIENWEKYARRCISDLLEIVDHVIVVDNGSQVPYPKSKDFSTVRLEKTISYPAALNVGLKHCPPSDWYIISNDDVTYNLEKMKHNLQNLNPSTLYGFYSHKIGDREFMPGFCLIFSDKLLNDVGLFDENLTPMYFEDADFCLRAVDAGYKLSVQDRDKWGIVHDPERGSEREENKHKYHWDINQAYVKRKHNLYAK